MIGSVFNSLISGLPVLLPQFLATLAVYAAGIAIYLRATPYHELELVRGGNVAAGITLAGALIGLALPLGATLSHSVSVMDIVIWGGVATALQAGTFGVVLLLIRDLTKAVERGEIAPAVVAAAAQIAVGLLNAGAMSS
jgi:putative membrane protein